MTPPGGVGPAGEAHGVRLVIFEPWKRLVGGNVRAGCASGRLRRVEYGRLVGPGFRPPVARGRRPLGRCAEDEFGSPALVFRGGGLRALALCLLGRGGGGSRRGGQSGCRLGCSLRRSAWGAGPYGRPVWLERGAPGFCLRVLVGGRSGRIGFGPAQLGFGAGDGALAASWTVGVGSVAFSGCRPAVGGGEADRRLSGFALRLESCKDGTI